jgi:PAS domain S-box-containing protein
MAHRGWSNLPLRIKTLIVLSVALVPLIVSSALVITTARRERAAQDRVSKALRIKSEIATGVHLTLDAETTVSRFLLTRDRESLRELTRIGSDWPAAMQRLAGLISGNPVLIQHGRAMGAMRGVRPIATLLEYARDHPDDPTPPADMLGHSRNALATLRRELSAMQEAEDAELAALLETARRARDQLVLATCGGAGLGLFGGVVAAVAFTSGITRRIDALRRNADRLARGLPLEPIQSDDDELGILSRHLTEAGSLLAARVQELDQFFNVSLDLLCTADLEGRFRRVNPAWEEVLGWTQADLTSVPYEQFVHPDDVAATRAASAALGRGDVVVNFENRYRCKDGSYRWLNWKAAALPSQGVIFAAARDVTEERRTALELRDRLAELGVVNQELEAFTYSVSHDLRAPLRHMTGFAALLDQTAGPKLTGEERRRLGTITDAASRMGALIDDLLAFSRIGRSPLRKERVALNDVVRDARRELAADPGAADVAWDVRPLPEVEGDPALLRLVFVNLLSNALKYTRGRPEPRIEVGTDSTAAAAVVYVRDNGVGFDMQYVHKLFGVFQRLHGTEEFEGTGIGLANVRRIVNRHGGTAWAEGAVDRGATFYVSLPGAGAPQGPQPC